MIHTAVICAPCILVLEREDHDAGLYLSLRMMAREDSAITVMVPMNAI